MPDNNHPIRVVQITDTHLGHHHGDTLMGLDTDMSLGLVVDKLLHERGSSDLLLATGDIANHASVEAYVRFKELTQNVAEETLWLPGNHDDVATMEQGFNEIWQQTWRQGDWQIIMLDSTIPKKPDGQLKKEQLAHLEQALFQTTAEFSLVCLHHHPIPCGADWLDTQVIKNSEDFLAIIDRHERVRGVLWGHIHQQIDELRDGVKFMATPSTCIQFAPNSNNFRLDPTSAGYRWLELQPDGEINTGVSRLDQVFDLDYNDSSGY